MTSNSNMQRVFVVNSPNGRNAARNNVCGVTVTPLITHPYNDQQQTQQIVKVVLKAVAKYDNKKSKTFTLRNIDVAALGTCSRLKSFIRAQLCEDITNSEFDVGYVSGMSIVSIRSGEDLMEIWSCLLIVKTSFYSVTV